MYPTTFVAIVLGFWSIFHLGYTFFLKIPHCGLRLGNFVLENNISITYFHVRWITSRWNRLFIRIARMWDRRLEWWFNSGVLVALAAMALATILLVHTLNTTINLIFFKPHTPLPDKTVPTLSVIVPGVNMPIQDVGYLLPAIFLSAILHEFGHAVAAAREDVHVNGFGVFVFLIYPGAFVDMNSDDLNRKTPITKLRVFCAGVWHNVVLCLIVCILLLCFPLLMQPFYAKSASGVLVAHQIKDSPLSGTMGLHVGDKVIKIDSCNVSNVSDWVYCINKTKKSMQWGSCMSLKRIHSQMSHTAYTHQDQSEHVSKSWQDCCTPKAPHTHLCYNYTPYASNRLNFACLPGRIMVSAKEDCMSNDDCSKLETNAENDLVCAKAYTETHFKFIRLVALRADSTKHNVLYVGDPVDILRSVTVSDLIPRLSIFPVRLPNILKRFLQYMFSMSSALALLNIAPCYALDGQWAFQAFLDYVDIGEVLSQQVKRTICTLVLWCGTFLLASNVLFGFMLMFAR